MGGKRMRNFIAAQFAANAVVLCGICSSPVGRDHATIDHIIPRAFGGPDASWNFEVVHYGCNHRKGGWMDERKARTDKQRDALRIWRERAPKEDKPDA